MKRDLVMWVAQHAYSARVNQLFEDGNHRTAVLSIFEKLADAGWILKADAFSMYIAISNRQCQATALVEANLCKCIFRHTFREQNVTVAQRAAYAADVKQIAAVNSLCEHAQSMLTSRALSREVKRQRWRAFRRLSGRRHAQYVRLYGVPIL